MYADRCLVARSLRAPGPLCGPRTGNRIPVGSRMTAIDAALENRTQWVTVDPRSHRCDVLLRGLVSLLHERRVDERTVLGMALDIARDERAVWLDRHAAGTGVVECGARQRLAEALVAQRRSHLGVPDRHG